MRSAQQEWLIRHAAHQALATSAQVLEKPNAWKALGTVPDEDRRQVSRP